MSPLTCGASALPGPKADAGLATAKLEADQPVLARPEPALARKFAPHRLPATIEELAAAALDTPHAGHDEIAAKLAQCDRRLTQYRAALDSGGDPAVVARWITETQAARASYQALKRPAPPRPSMSRQEITTIVNTFADLLEVVRSADPADKAEIYARLGLRLTYQPQERTVRAETRHWHFESVRGGTRPLRTYLLSPVSWSSAVHGDRASGPVDQVHDNRLCGATGADRRHRLLPAYAHASGTARPTGLGRGADSAIGGRDDRGGIHHTARRLTVGQSRRRSALGVADCWQRRQPGRQRRRGRTNPDWPRHRGMAIIRAYRGI